MELINRFFLLKSRGVKRNSIGILIAIVLAIVPNAFTIYGSIISPIPLTQFMVDLIVLNLPFIAFSLVFELLEAYIPVQRWLIRSGVFWTIAYPSIVIIREMCAGGLMAPWENAINDLSTMFNASMIYYGITVGTGFAYGVMFALLYSQVYNYLLTKGTIPGDENVQE